MLYEESLIIKDVLKNINGKKILNVCSSDEKFWKELQPFIWENVISPLLERGNKVVNLDKKESKGVDIVCDCQDMGIVDNNSYDVVIFTSGIEHLEFPKKALKEIKRVLKEDGFMVCSAPGVYPEHNDPFDNMLRFPTRESWVSYLGKDWVIESFFKTTPEKAKPIYDFKELVFATIIKAYPIK